ncbi:TetR family transcriptional regulator [Antricoccus suffuscus]|uniref:TetR family transcriptional regulator n=1 Tax=Antricoccus suffuscus TaxID=1629062 RepID=A0A2T0ZJW3_9ACTN|nr:TetR/AcrR family transcriptional regulator [Antricoccus suffuscus]PRZ36595.1 TetR family transcriptional regulator [Antricoccus suffuscus]
MTADRDDEIIWLRREHANLGRPAERSRAQLTAAAVRIADVDGLDAVSMRRVAADLGTGAGSLYRYVAARDDLLDLMIDAVAEEYEFTPSTGDAIADLLDIGRQMRQIMHAHPWLPAMVATTPTLGPNGIDLLEHVLGLLADHPADVSTKLETFAMLNALVSSFVQSEVNGNSGAQRRQAAYLAHVAAAGDHPRIAAAVADAPLEMTGADRFDALVGRALIGLLGDAGK